MNRRNRRSVASAMTAVAIAMAATPALAQNNGQPSDLRKETKTGANFLSPLKAAARAASRQLWGYMSYATAWPTASHQYGFMAFDAATASGFTDLRTESERTLQPNGGSSYRDGKYDLINYKTSGNSIIITYYQLNTNNKWASSYAPESVTDMSLLATETATSRLTGKVYGQFYTADMSAFDFGVIDYNTMKRSTIAASTHKYVAMGCSSDERVYGVATDGNLYEIDVLTGEEKKIGPTGVFVAPSSEKSFGQSGEIDPEDDTFYWAALDADRHGALYTVDLSTGLATKIADFPHDEQFYGLAIPETAPADGAPASPTVSVKFDGASTEGWLSISTPGKTYGGQTLSGELTYTMRSGKTLVATGKVNANSSTTVKITAPEGMNYFSTTLSNAAGTSKPTATTAFVGYDTPKQASFATLKIEASTGKATIKWGAPTATVNGGYLGSLTYDIVRYPEGKKVATAISGTQFTETINDRQLRNYYYGVTPINGSKRGEERLTAAVNYGDNIEPPYKETFATQSAFDLYKTIDANGDGSTWDWDDVDKCAYYATANKTANDWLVTPPIHLQANHAYRVAFTASKSLAFYDEKIEARWGNAATESALSNNFLSQTSIPSGGNTYSGEIKSTKDQLLYFGIHALSSAQTGRILVKDFSIEDYGCLEGPAAVENLTITPDPTTALKSTISFRLPSKNVAGNAVAQITKVVVTRDGTTVKEFGQSAAGSTLTCTDNSPVEGFNNYTITAYTAAGAGTSTTIAAYVGLDVPAVPQNIEAKDNLSNVALTWDATPALGTNGGAVIQKDVTFNVYRVRNVEGNVSQQLIGSTTEPKYTDNINTATGAQTVGMYTVSAKNSKGESLPQQSPIVLSGAAYQLPFSSNFVKTDDAPLWWSLTGDADNGRGFLQNEQTSSDGDNNCLSFTSYSNGSSADINSGKIALAGASNPSVVFSHNATSGKNAKLEVYAQPAGGKQQLIGTIDYATVSGKSDEWHRSSFKIPADMAKASYVVLTFKGTADIYGIIQLDDVKVRNAYANDLAVDVKAPATVKKGATVSATVTVTNNGEKTVSGYHVTLKTGSTTFLDETVSDALEPLASKTFNVDVTSDVNSKSSKLNFVASVEYAADEYTANNTATFAADLTESGIPMPANFSATKDESTSTLSMRWDTPEPASNRMRETFEKYDNWTIDQFGDWTTYTSKKGSKTGGWWGSYGMAFPHENEGYTYIVFNPDAIQNGITSENASIKAHSGSKSLMCMFSYDIVNKKGVYYDNDDWLISPMLSGLTQKVIFWANNAQPDMSNIRYPQTIELLYSDKTNAPADFQKLEEFTQSGGAWSSFSAQLPDGANYFAIRCTTKSDNAYCLLLDDISYYSGFGKLQGYNVYRNGELVEHLDANATSYTLQYDPTAPPTRYSVSAVYTGGESPAASSDECQTAINGITVDALHPVDVYTVDGKLVMKNATSLQMLKRGVYVINGVKVVK